MANTHSPPKLQARDWFLDLLLVIAGVFAGLAAAVVDIGFWWPTSVVYAGFAIAIWSWVRG